MLSEPGYKQTKTLNGEESPPDVFQHSGGHDNRNFRIDLVDAIDELDPGHLGNKEIGDDELKSALILPTQGLLRILNGNAFDSYSLRDC